MLNTKYAITLCSIKPKENSGKKGRMFVYKNVSGSALVLTECGLRVLCTRWGGDTVRAASMV